VTARIAIVGCGAAKLDRPAPARDLYTGGLFRAAVADVEGRGLRYRILSAKFALVQPWHVLPPYDQRLADALAALDALGSDFRKRYLAIIAGHLGNWSQGIGWGATERPVYVSPHEAVVVEVHAGAAYVNVVREALELWPGRGRITLEEPCRGMEIGERLAFYARRREHQPGEQLGLWRAA
jgi:hypothetical protein